jgi:hypothetical protein
MFKLVSSICFLNLSQFASAHEDKSHVESPKTNFTLSEFNGQTTILELWSELLTLPNDQTQQRLDGKLYITNANLLS